MVADIRIKTSFLNHRKRRKLKLLLGVDATGNVLDLWINAAMNNPDGVLRGMDHEDIALDAGWDGDPRQFCEALIAVAFLDVLPCGTYALHDWAEHQSWVVTSPARVARSRKANEVRWSRDQKAARAEEKGAGPGVPEPEKMPEVGQKLGAPVLEASNKDAQSIQQGCGEDAGRMRVGLPSSSSSPLKGINTPPERTEVLSSPVGGEVQVAGKRFAPPSVAEIAAYCAQRGNGLDAEHIHAHYTANGWRVGQNPMKNWRAAVITWEKRKNEGCLEQRAAAHAQSPAAKLLAKTQGGTS